MEKGNKTEIISNYQSHEKDTGSTEVQVALLTGRIRHLSGHMAENRHGYNKLIKSLGLRK